MLFADSIPLFCIPHLGDSCWGHRPSRLKFPIALNLIILFWLWFWFLIIINWNRLILEVEQLGKGGTLFVRPPITPSTWTKGQREYPPPCVVGSRDIRSGERFGENHEECERKLSRESRLERIKAFRLSAWAPCPCYGRGASRHYFRINRCREIAYDQCLYDLKHS